MSENMSAEAAKKNYTPLLLVGIFVALFFALIVFTKMDGQEAVQTLNNEVSPSADLSVSTESARAYLYTSENCQHCQQVMSYLSDKPDLYEKTGLIKQSLDEQAYYDERQRQLGAYANLCGLDSRTGVPIPFLYLADEELLESERCLIGDRVIIDYLETQR